MDFRTQDSICGQILLTINIPEDESFLEDFKDLPIRIIRNEKPKGFGSNHNAAFRFANTPYFVVVNPDIRLASLQIELLLKQFKNSDVGISAPLVYSSNGQIQDSARIFPSFSRLIMRHLAWEKRPDYSLSDDEIEVDWVGGMFMVFRSTTYHKIHGFNERYFMYFEDVDLCKRLHRHGYKVILVPGTHVIHDAQRASRRNMRHLFWHISSALRFFFWH
jgi:GT2 family glycosyltransferase